MHLAHGGKICSRKPSDSKMYLSLPMISHESIGFKCDLRWSACCYAAKWYMVLVAYALGPFIAIPNSYGTGLTDQDNCSMYAKVALFVFAAWAGEEGFGVIAGCAICGVVMVSTTNAAVLMQDFRTAYITKTSPLAMLAAQWIGSALGVLLSPMAFSLFWQTGLVSSMAGSLLDLIPSTKR